jgi:integrase
MRRRSGRQLDTLHPRTPKRVTILEVGEGFHNKPSRLPNSQAPGKLVLHSLRHSFASLLIANGLNVVFVSRQLGHANPNITLEVYAHLFQHADHAHTARDALEASYTAINATGV